MTMGGLGFPELLVFLLVVLLLFGSTKVPKLARSMGEASKELRKGLTNSDGSEPLAEEQITMTRAELDAVLAERDAETRTATPRDDIPPSV